MHDIEGRILIVGDNVVAAYEHYLCKGVIVKIDECTVDVVLLDVALQIPVAQRYLQPCLQLYKI